LSFSSGNKEIYFYQHRLWGFGGSAIVVKCGSLSPPCRYNAKQETDQDTDGATYQALDPIPGGHAPRVISLHHILPGSRGHYY